MRREGVEDTTIRNLVETLTGQRSFQNEHVRYEDLDLFFRGG